VWVVVVVVCLVLLVPCTGILIALLLPAVQSAREAARRSQCQNNLRQIAMALIQYDMTRRGFPPAGAGERKGQPAQSWRVAILPYLEQEHLYRQYDTTQPWNSPKNKALAAMMPSVFRCPSDPKGSPTSQETSYVMIVGKGTLGGLSEEGKRVGTDYVSSRAGTGTTLLVVEIPGSGIPWMEPRDLTIDEVIERVKSSSRGGHSGGVNVVFCDGHVQFIRENVSPETLRRLANPDRKEPVSDTDY
jgi:prepilin-type processing-associated H-X9-DG protein